MTARPTRPPAVETAIRHGLGPSLEVIDEVTAADAVLLGDQGLHRERLALRQSLTGAGRLEPVLSDPSVTDVLVNGDGSVWVDRGRGVERSPVRIDRGEVRPLAVRLAGLVRRRLDDAQPWVDGLLPDGIRLHAVLPPLAEGGAHVSLRIPRVQPAGIAGLQAVGMVTPEQGTVLRAMLEARLSFVVTGGTGSGKTTLLGGLLSACPAGERLVIVEDVRELNPRHPHVVSLQGRGANVEGAGAVTMVDLVRQALRMRPDRLVVGEVRGAEVRELLAALNTGHEGGAGTLHANGVGEVVARFEALGALAGMPSAAVHAQLRGAVRVVIHVAREGGARFVREIALVRSAVPVEVISALTRTREGTDRGPGWAELAALLAGRGSAVS